MGTHPVRLYLCWGRMGWEEHKHLGKAAGNSPPESKLGCTAVSIVSWSCWSLWLDLTKGNIWNCSEFGRLFTTNPKGASFMGYRGERACVCPGPTWVVWRKSGGGCSVKHPRPCLPEDGLSFFWCPWGCSPAQNTFVFF